MKAGVYLKKRQVLWALSNGIALQGSKGDRGELAYTTSLDRNLLEPLQDEVRREYEQGNGNEFGTPRTSAKMQAVHSSSAIVVNAFSYWKHRGECGDLKIPAQALRIPTHGLVSLRFEAKLPVSRKQHHYMFPIAPNIDVLFEYKGGSYDAVGVECKFTEAYAARGHLGLRPAYLDRTDLWYGLPEIGRFARTISPDDTKYKHLHPAQLVKHILGLRHAYGGRFRLLYLWYDVPFSEGTAHRKEIEEFAAIVKADKVHFQSLTWQEFILRIAGKHDSKHEGYVNYMVQRYL